jgi:Tfp pilus assembly protein PilF
MKSPTWIVTAVFLGATLAGCARTAKPPSAADEARHQQRAVSELVERGKLFAQMGDATRAEQYLNAALEGGADDKQVFPLLLGVCIKDGRYRAAAGYTEHYLRKHPANHRLRFVLATLYVGLDDAERARKHFEEVIAASPTLADAHYAYAVLLRDHAGDHAGADRHFREYLRMRPRGDHAEEAQASLLQRVP